MGRINANDLFDFHTRVVRVGLRQIHLIQHGKDLNAEVQCGVAIRDCLRFNPLTGIDNQQRTFTGGQLARDFVR